MLVLYNIVQIFLLPLLLPFLILAGLFNGKYRNRIPARLGIGLSRKLNKDRSPGPRFWLHALSVGEVTSAHPLLAGIRQAYPDATIIVSVTTRSGRQVASTLPARTVDHVIDGPFDFLPVVLHFISRIRPHFYILVETDFWPNTLLVLKKKGIPTLLVNGRVSKKSMQGYRRMAFFFRPMFQSLSALSMQTERDKDNMVALGIDAQRLYTLGNLKFDTRLPLTEKSTPVRPPSLPDNALIFICGSTHPGEEVLMLDSYCNLRSDHPELFLIVAPRDTNRARDIQKLGEERGLKVATRTGETVAGADMFVLDTIGELIDFYSFADIAFVGGSLVKEGGHNPIEPGAMGIPVLFGPDMEDFSEIAVALIKTGGGIEITGQAQLEEQLLMLIDSPELRKQYGRAAKECIVRQQGVIDKHLHIISRFL
ncbi:MAG: 3-deoxy-D-manno-octulosonic acid transferase [Desulforhopalus sp.]